MAVEEHPKFGEWAQALDALKLAKDAYQAAVAFNQRPQWIDHAKGLLAVAQEHFDDISREVR